jgi:hypothetical protein
MTAIETLDAGPELDAMVAEQVMKWTKFIGTGGGTYWNDESGHFVGGDTRWPVPPYSSDIAAAWEIVEDFGSSFVSLTHAYGEADGEIQDGWWCEVIGPGYAMRQFADTAPLAICRAALAAKRQRN